MNDVSDDSNYALTVGVTIEIDDDVLPELPNIKNDASNKNSQSGSSIVIGPPLSVKTFDFNVNESAKINQLTEEARDKLFVHLSVPTYTSMANWEKIGELMRIDNDKILLFRYDQRPPLALLNFLGPQRLNELINAIKLSNRIDLLCELKTLQNYEMLYSTKPTIRSNNDFQPPTYSNAATVDIGDLKAFQEDYSNAILVNHYEITEQERKHYRWFLKNMKAHLQKYNLRVVDVEQLEEDENRMPLLQHVFKQAKHIVFCFSPSYIEIINNSERLSHNQTVYYRTQLHGLADTEYFKNGARNKRFRPILLSDVKFSDLPNSWACNTVIFSFPQEVSKIMERLTKSDNDSGQHYDHTI